MTTIIISRPSTRTHEFEGTTDGGRKLKVSVVAAVDVQPSAVLADIQETMPQVNDLEFVDDDGPIHPLEAALTVMFLWICILLAGLLGTFFAHKAGFIDVNQPVHRWNESIPIVGGYSILYGLFRAWVAALPIIVVVMPILAWWEARNWNDDEN